MEQVELDELLSRSRFVTLHARVTPETTGMIGAAQIAAMPAGSVIVNCARGALLDYDAVCDALDSGPPVRRRVRRLPRGAHPAGLAAADARPNIVMTPHLAGRQQGDGAEGGGRSSPADVGRYLRGEELAHCANPEALRDR